MLLGALLPILSVAANAQRLEVICAATTLPAAFSSYSAWGTSLLLNCTPPFHFLRCNHRQLPLDPFVATTLPASLLILDFLNFFEFSCIFLGFSLYFLFSLVPLSFVFSIFHVSSLYSPSL